MNFVAFRPKDVFYVSEKKSYLLQAKQKEKFRHELEHDSCVQVQMSLLKKFISGPDAALHLASLVAPLVANHSGVKCVVDSNKDAVLVKDVALLIQLLDIEHPVGQMIISACSSHQKQHGSGVKTLLSMIGLFTNAVVSLREQGIPVVNILSLMRAAIQECVLVCEQLKISIDVPGDACSRWAEELAAGCSSRTSHVKESPVQSGLNSMVNLDETILQPTKCMESIDGKSSTSDDRKLVLGAHAIHSSVVQSDFEDQPSVCIFESDRCKMEKTAEDDDIDDVAWFFQDLSDADSDSGLGGKVEVVQNVKSLFSLSRPVDIHIPSLRDAEQYDSDFDECFEDLSMDNSVKKSNLYKNDAEISGAESNSNNLFESNQSKCHSSHWLQSNQSAKSESTHWLESDQSKCDGSHWLQSNQSAKSESTHWLESDQSKCDGSHWLQSNQSAKSESSHWLESDQLQDDHGIVSEALTDHLHCSKLKILSDYEEKYFSVHDYHVEQNVGNMINSGRKDLDFVVSGVKDSVKQVDNRTDTSSQTPSQFQNNSQTQRDSAFHNDSGLMISSMNTLCRNAGHESDVISFSCISECKKINSKDADTLKTSSVDNSCTNVTNRNVAESQQNGNGTNPNLLDVKKLNNILKTFKSESHSVDSKVIMNCSRHFKTFASSVDGMKDLQLTGDSNNTDDLEIVSCTGGLQHRRETMKDFKDDNVITDGVTPEYKVISNIKRPNNKMAERSISEISSAMFSVNRETSDISRSISKMDECPVSSGISYPSDVSLEREINRSVLDEHKFHSSFPHLLKLGKTIQQTKRHGGLSQSRHFREFSDTTVLDSRDERNAWQPEEPMISSNIHCDPHSQNTAAMVEDNGSTVSEQNISLNQDEEQTDSKDKERFSLDHQMRSLRTEALSCDFEKCFSEDRLGFSKDSTLNVEVSCYQQDSVSEDGLRSSVGLTLTVDEVARGLSHGFDETMGFVVTAFHNQQKAMQNEERVILNVKLLHTCVVECTASQQSRLIEGLVLSIEWQQMDCINRKSKQKNVLLVNGDISLSYRHAGFKPAAAVSTILNTIPLKSSSPNDEFISQCVNILKQLSVDMVLSRGKVDSIIKDVMLSNDVVVMEMVDYHALEVLQVSSKASCVTYLTEAIQSDVCTVFVDVLQHDWMDKLYTRERPCLISIQDPHRLVQTFVSCHPSKQAAQLIEQEFWLCANRLSSALHDGTVLPGGGKLEEECARHLMSLGDQELSSENGQIFYSVVCESVADCFLNFCQTIKRNSGQDETEANTNGNSEHTGTAHCPHVSSLPDKLYDNFQTKMAAWKCALDTVSVIVQTDVLVITGISQRDTVHTDSVLF